MGEHCVPTFSIFAEKGRQHNQPHTHAEYQEGKKENKHFSKLLEGPSEEAMGVAYAYDKADFKSKNTARHALDLPMLVTKNHLIENTSSVDDKSAYSLPLFEQIAQAEGEYIKTSQTVFQKRPYLPPTPPKTTMKK